MSQIVPLSSIPNQSFDVTLEDTRYSFRFYACVGCMAFDLKRNGSDVVLGQRLVAGSLLIPYTHQYYGKGNFVVITNSDELPYYDEFGVSQFLVYFTAAEMTNA